MKQLIAVPVLLALVALVGCGEKGPETTKVSGKVTLADGSPLPGGRIDFHSAEHGMATGTINADGTYEAQDIKPGEYKVSIENSHLKGLKAAEVPAGTQAMPGSDQSYVAIDPKFTKPDTSGLSVTVGDEDKSYDVQLK